MIIPSHKRLLDALERSENGTEDPGFCTACGYEREGCEPDARNYECYECGEHKVHGLYEFLI